MKPNDKPVAVNRRLLLGGAGTAGALAAAAALLPKQAQVDDVADAKPTPEKGGGYQLTEHVLRYYQTARV